MHIIKLNEGYLTKYLEFFLNPSTIVNPKRHARPTQNYPTLSTLHELTLKNSFLLLSINRNIAINK
ncbi:hypothetical protein SAMN04515667_2118 [Formosa sp. Hel1_31_208]|nr:hypothetical protein SAMN04515667_2118 [Formosa sp. Hel1_31_208]